jgi:hypothetical protein
MSLYAIEAAYDLGASFCDVLDGTAGADFSAGWCFLTHVVAVQPVDIGILHAIWKAEGSPAIDCIALSETNETCAFVTKIAVSVCVKDLTGCWASVADMAGA